MPSPRITLSALFLIAAVSSVSHADPYAEPPPGDDDPTRYTEPDHAEPAVEEVAPPAAPATVEVVMVAPGTRAPVTVAPSPDPCAGPVDADPCSARAHGRSRWMHGSPRWRGRGHLTVGLTAGRIALEDDTDGKQRSLLARATGRRGWGIELELARATFGDDHARTIGGSLMKTFGQRHLAPYVLVGAGGGVLERESGTESQLRFREFGGGLLLRARRFAIGIDVRRGARTVETEVMPVMGAISRTTEAPDDRESYTRARFLALVMF